ncbi:MAG: hypothetical protein QW609_03680 [Candidatus Aenigmatarchaeota archaeon]
MKFVLLTYDGHGLPIAFKLQQEGWDVIVGQAVELPHMPEENPEVKKRRLELFDGLLEKKKIEEVIEFLRKEKKKDDYFIFSDFNYVFPYAEQVKKMGYFGLFPTKEDFEFEENRNKAKEYIAKNHPLFAQQEVHEFKTVEEAKEFLKNTDKIWVLKGNNPEAETFVATSNIPTLANEEILEILEEGKKIYESEGFILEEKIEDLIEFVPEIIVRGKRVLGMNIDVELKPFGPANCSFQTGDAASVIFWIFNQEQAVKIYDMFFRPMEEKFLRSDNEFVIWDVGVMYSPSRNKFYFSEFCSNREGWSSLFNKLSTFSRISDYYLAIKEGELLLELKPMRFGASFRIFNMLTEGEKPNLSLANVRILTDINDKNIWIWDMKKVANKIVSVGYDRNLAVVTSSDEDWQLAFLKADSLIDFGFKFDNFYKRSFMDIIDNGYTNNIPDRLAWIFENLLEEKWDFKPLYNYKIIKKMLINNLKDKKLIKEIKKGKKIEDLEKEFSGLEKLLSDFSSLFND